MEKLANFINGKAVDSTSGETSPLINPATGKEYARAPKSNAADIDLAFKAASNAFPGWRDSTPSQRQKALLKIADAIESRADEIIAIEQQTPVSQSL
ncbi:gamma-aminobutyraldehyde dehydrogenase [Actinomycetota bacterium]|nr:gamma-aminobutyraldehyde dehydrogenase [Actinomycetota bacterium]